jgi:hypothetical protein
MISLPDGNSQSGPGCRGSDCRIGLQSEKHHKKSVTYSGATGMVVS